MSEDAGSHEHRGRRSRGGPGWATIAGWAVAAVLAAYLVYGMLHQEGGRPQAPFSEETLLATLFWGSVGIAAVASAAGILWTVQAHARRAKDSLVWMRHAFTFGVVAAVLLAAVPRSKDGHWYIAWAAAALVAGQSALFAYAAWREVQRSHGGRRSRHGDDDGDAR